MPTLVNFLGAQGTETTKRAAHPPCSNPDPEGKNRTIFNAVRTALATSGFDLRYWTYAAADAVNKLNFIPQRQPDEQYRPAHHRAWGARLVEDINAPPVMWPARLPHQYPRNKAQARDPRPIRPIPHGALAAPVPSATTQRHSPPGAGQRIHTKHWCRVTTGHDPAGQCPEVACVKHQGPAKPRCAGRRCADILEEPSADPSSPRDPAAQPTTEAAHSRPRPAAERASPHCAGKCVQPLEPPTGPRHHRGGSPASPCRGHVVHYSGHAQCAASDQGSPRPPGRR
jgi:hypothetical protein